LLYLVKQCEQLPAYKHCQISENDQCSLKKLKENTESKTNYKFTVYKSNFSPSPDS